MGTGAGTREMRPANQTLRRGSLCDVFERAASPVMASVEASSSAEAVDQESRRSATEGGDGVSNHEPGRAYVTPFPPRPPLCKDWRHGLQVFGDMVYRLVMW
jgi:hypothetical protein